MALTTNDLKQIADFKKIVLAYEKIIKLLKRKTDMKQELKPCPMCAKTENKVFSTAERRLNGAQRHHVECLLCGAKGGIRLTKEEAITAWNSRPDHSDESTEIDWEHRRYEIAKDCVSATLSRTHIVCGEIKDVVGYSIRVADELINQLKQNNDEKIK